MVKTLMFQGTGSSVGKSVVVAGIARALRNRGYRVLPFKPQNMSNNAAVTADHGEIGRAQALQAVACGVEPIVHMNPVLLKPQDMTGSQIIVQGKLWGKAKAREYQTVKADLLHYAKESFNILSQQADIVLIEGAGSASEINLRQHDIANMGFAQAVDAPVVLIGDIDRGGVIASLVGTHAVLSQEDLKRVKGFIVNKMRGDASLFKEAMDWIADRTMWHALGLLPYFSELKKLPAEDAADLKNEQVKFNKEDMDGNLKKKLHISVLLFPTLANFDDFDPLRHEEGVQLEFVAVGQAIPVETDVIILPGSKATIADLQCLYETGWDIDIRSHLRRNRYVMGICGGYQMLGRRIMDPAKIESNQCQMQGLGLLEISTIMTHKKQLQQVQGCFAQERSVQCSGYEMHVGETVHHRAYQPFICLGQERKEGVVSDNGLVLGTYLHGLFHDSKARHYLLNYFGGKSKSIHFGQEVDKVLDLWANHIEQHVSVPSLLEIMR